MNETQATTVVETLADLLWVGRALVIGVGMLMGLLTFRVIRDAANRKNFWALALASGLLYANEAQALPSGYVAMSEWNAAYPQHQLTEEGLFEAIESHSGWDLQTLYSYYEYMPPPDTTFEEWCASQVDYEIPLVPTDCFYNLQPGNFCTQSGTPPAVPTFGPCYQDGAVVWRQAGTFVRNETYTYTLPGCGSCTSWTYNCEYRVLWDLVWSNTGLSLPVPISYYSGWTAGTCNGGCTGCTVGTGCAHGNGCGVKQWGNVTCVESFLLNAGCAGQLNCGDDTRDCYVCAVSGCAGLDCTTCDDPDPDPRYIQCCGIDPNTGSPIIGVDSDDDGTCDMDEPNGCGCPGTPPDTDCDGCDDEQDSDPTNAGGTCDDPDECDESADSDCDGCDDVDEGSNNGNPACACTVEGGEHDGKTDTDCDGCPDDLDPDNNAPTRGDQCSACAEKGGDTDDDGCCDDEDDEPDKPKGADEDCKGCSTAVMSRLGLIKNNIAGKMMLGSAYQGGSDLFVPVTLDFGNLGGREMSATFDLQQLSVGSTSIDTFAQGWRTAMRRILAGFVYFAAVYKVLHLFKLFG